MRKFYIVLIVLVALVAQLPEANARAGKALGSKTSEVITLVPDFKESDWNRKEVQFPNNQNPFDINISRKDELHIEGLGTDNWNLFLISRSGEVVIRKQVVEDTTIELSDYDLSTGIYLLELSRGMEKKSMKVLVRK